MGEPAYAVASLVAARDERERRTALESVAAEGARALPLLEGALADLLREAPEALPVAVQLAAEAARREDPVAQRILSIVARANAPADVRRAALEALRGEAEAPPPSPFAQALEELASNLPASPLREKLARVARAPGLAPEIVARAFAAAYEAARATGDARLLALARERLAPALEAHGLVAGFDHAADEGAFDVRPALGADAGALGRPAVRSRAGAVVVRGVVFAAATASPAPAVAPADELASAVRAALAPGASPEAREAALAALVRALASRLAGDPVPASVTALRADIEQARAGNPAPFLTSLARGLAALAPGRESMK